MKIKNNPARYENEINGIIRECEGKRYSDEFISGLSQLLIKIQNGDAIGSLNLEDSAKANEEDVIKFYERKVVESILGAIFKNYGEPLSDETELLADFYVLVQAQKQSKNKINWTKEKQSCDFLVWKQILRRAKDINRPILFVTADIQPNFWLFDKKLNSRVPHPALLAEFKSYVGTDDNFNMISLNEFFKLCSNYLNSDIEHLIKYMQVDEQIRDRFDTWFPEELMDNVNEYLADNSEVQSLIEDSIDSCYDYAEINGFEFPEIEEIDYSIDEDVILYEGYLTIYVDVDADYHCSGEDGTIDSAYLQLGMAFTCNQNIVWESNESGRIALENNLYGIKVSDIDVIWMKENEHSFEDEDICEENHLDSDFENDDEDY